jgi:RecG-like helicase
MQELTNIVTRKYIVTVEVTVDRDQVTERPDAVDKIEEVIDNEMYYFNESLLPGSVKDIVEENLQVIDSEIHNHQPEEIRKAYELNRFDIYVDVTESTQYLDQIENEANSLS